MSEKTYISVSEYAKIKGVSPQAVYKQLNNKLKEFVILVEGKKRLKIEVLNEVEQQKLNEVEQPIQQPFEQQFNNFYQPFFEKQIEEKDKTIESLLKQIDSLQEQNSRLTELLYNEQCLVAAAQQEKKLYIEQETTGTTEQEEPKEKKGFFSWLKRKQLKYKI